jgi:hypothetical protein
LSERRFQQRAGNPATTASNLTYPAIDFRRNSPCAN